MAKRPESDPQSALASYTARRTAAIASYKGMLDQRGNALLSVNEASGLKSKPYQTVQQRLGDSESELSRIKAQVRRPLSRIGVRPSILLIVGVALALLEAPANKFLFDVALQSSGLASFGASAAVTAFLLILAHLAGKSIRQVWSEYRRRPLIWSAVAFLFCIAVDVVIVGILTVARAAFAGGEGSIADLVEGLKGTVSSAGPIAAVINALSNTSALVLACINIGGIITTMMLAFFAHDPDRDYDQAAGNVERDEKELAAIHDRYLKARAKVIKEYAPDLIGFAENYNAANKHLVEMKTLLGRPLDDDDRFVLTDLDQMAEEAEAAEAANPTEPPPQAPADKREPNLRAV